MTKSNLKLEIKNEILSKKDIKYKEFHKSLCPGINNIIGVRTPILRNIAKELMKEYTLKEIYNEIDTEYYEEIMLKGMLICLSKDDFNILKPYIENYVPLIDNWAICDTFVTGLKITKKYKKELRNLILKYKTSKKEYELRFMIVMILSYYIEEEYLEENFELFNKIKSDKYYVQMAIAWALSISIIKYYDQTIKYLKTAKIDDFIYNKTISKACDSYRITKKQKEDLRKMRRK